MKMKAITLWQPWASLVVGGYKKIETRSWDTNHRGWLAVHAAKREPLDARTLGLINPYFATCLDAMGYYPGMWPRGVILGFVWLETTVPTKNILAELTRREKAFGDYSPGRFAWLLRHQGRLPKPVPVRGRQGLWNWEIPEGTEGIPIDFIFK